MEISKLMLFLIIIISYAMGVAVGNLVYKNRCDGVLVIDETGELTDRFLFQLDAPIEQLYTGKDVRLKIERRPLTEEDKWPNEN